MKGILEFVFPDDEQEFRVASVAMDWYFAMWELDQWLRVEIKHQEKDYQAIRDKLHEILGERSLDLYMVT